MCNTIRRIHVRNRNVKIHNPNGYLAGEVESSIGVAAVFDKIKIIAAIKLVLPTSNKTLLSKVSEF